MADDAVSENLTNNTTRITNGNNESNINLLQSLVKSEFALQSILTRTRPILSLPTPKSLSDVEAILSLARSYSTRTSAPAGWNPSLQLVHFSGPHPLPHQLRTGVLGAMQRTLVADERRAKKRKRKEEEEAKRKLCKPDEKRNKTVIKEKSQGATWNLSSSGEEDDSDDSDSGSEEEEEEEESE